MHEILENIFSYLKGMWRYRWYGLLIAAVISVVGWTFVLRMPDEYRVSARIYVDTQSMLRPLLRGLTVNVNPDSQISLMTRTLVSQPNLQKVARMTDLDIKVKNNEEMEELLISLRERISISTERRQNLYQISFDDPDPQLAKKIVQALLTIFIEDTLGETRQDSDAAQRFLDKQINEYEARLLAAENRVKEFKREYSGLLPSDRNAGGYYQQLQSARAALEEASLELRQAEMRRDAIKRQLAGEEPSFGLGPEEAVYSRPREQSLTVPVDSRIHALEQRLDQLLLQYTERHPDIVAARETIAKLKAQRQQAIQELQASLAEQQQQQSQAPRASNVDANPVYQQLKLAMSNEEVNVAALQVRVDEYQGRVASLEERINMVPEIEAKMKSLNRDYEVTRKNYDELLARRESAYLSQQAGQTTDGIRFRVIDPPRVPLEPSGPNRLMYMSMVLAAAVGAGATLAILLSQIWSSFETRRSLMEATNFPVFGCVGTVLSPAVLRRQRMATVLYLSLAMGLLMVYAGLMVMQVTGIRIL